MTWKGKSLFRYAGFKAGEVESKQPHVDPQRDYSWTAEHWDDLWMDIDEIERGGKQHYMGALVLQEQKPGPGAIELAALGCGGKSLR